MPKSDCSSAKPALVVMPRDRVDGKAEGQAGMQRIARRFRPQHQGLRRRITRTLPCQSSLTAVADGAAVAIVGILALAVMVLP